MKVYSETLNDERARNYVCQNSMERIINSAIKIAEKTLETDVANDDEMRHLLEVNLQDLQDAKSIVTNLWNDARNSIHIDEMVKRGDALGYSLKRQAEAKELKRLEILPGVKTEAEK